MAKVLNLQMTVTVLKTATYLVNGCTTVVLCVELHAPVDGLHTESVYTLSISALQVRSRKVMAELALVCKHEVIKLELGGVLDGECYIEVDKLFYLQNLSRAAL